MDLQRAYKGMDTSPGDLEKMLDRVMHGRLPSDHPMTRLHRILRINLILTVVITTAFMALAFITPEPLVLLLFSALLVFSVWSVMDSVRLLKGLGAGISCTNSLMTEMQRQSDLIQRWIRLQGRVALAVYPFSIAGGFIWGGIEGSGLDALTFLKAPWVAEMLTIIILVLVPVCYFAARGLSRWVFGRHLSALEQRIEELRTS